MAQHHCLHLPFLFIITLHKKGTQINMSQFQGICSCSEPVINY
uniref:Uncharacterized protein n=1 Tax=Arundo donax TaxID=35708 RepID=A0A0A8ZZM5_ARUDO